MGDTKASIQGKGLVYLSFENTTFDLYETLYVPRFHINILSAKRAKKGGIYHNQRLNRLKKEHRTPICNTSDETGITLILRHQNKPMQYNNIPIAALTLLPQKTIDTTTIEPKDNGYIPINDNDKPKKDDPIALASSYNLSSLKGSESLWHQRLGHPSLDTVKYLENSITGAVVDHFLAEKPSYETYLISKAKRQVSRRPIHTRDYPFETLYWDLIHLSPGINNN